MFTLLTKVQQHTSAATSASNNAETKSAPSSKRSPTITPPSTSRSKPKSTSTSTSTSTPTETPTQRRARINFQRLMRTCEEMLTTGKYRQVEWKESTDTKENKSSSPPHTGMSPSQAHLFTSYLTSLSSQLSALSTHTHTNPIDTHRRIQFLRTLASRHGCNMEDMMYEMTHEEKHVTRDVMRYVDAKQNAMWRSQLLERERKQGEKEEDMTPPATATVTSAVTSTVTSPSSDMIPSHDIPTTTPSVINITPRDNNKQRLTTWTADNHTANIRPPSTSTSTRRRVARSHHEERTLAQDAIQHEAILTDVTMLTSQLKDSVHRIHDAMQHDRKILDEVETKVEKNLGVIKKESNRLEEIVNRSCGQTCSIYLLLIIVICVWMGTYLMIRIMPSPPRE